jgi:hypothetical protein
MAVAVRLGVDVGGGVTVGVALAVGAVVNVGLGVLVGPSAVRRAFSVASKAVRVRAASCGSGGGARLSTKSHAVRTSAGNKKSSSRRDLFMLKRLQRQSAPNTHRVAKWTALLPLYGPAAK